MTVGSCWGHMAESHELCGQQCPVRTPPPSSAQHQEPGQHTVTFLCGLPVPSLVLVCVRPTLDTPSAGCQVTAARAA